MGVFILWRLGRLYFRKEAMSYAAYRKTYAPGARIFREGEAGDCAYIVERGSVEISALQHGRSVRLARLGVGELFGEMALLDDAVRTATATTLEETDVVIVPREHIEQRVTQADPLLNFFMRVILRRFREERARSANAAGDEVPESFLSTTQRAAFSRDQVRAVSRLNAEYELRRALAEGELQMYFQPIVHLLDGSPAGFEALVRWNHPERGLLSPSGFIPLAEEMDILMELGDWAIESACNARRRFSEASGLALFMTINLSGRQVTDPGLVDRVARTLERTRTDAANVKLEITETLLMQDPEMAATVLGRLKDLGLRLALDDFGTGYSSLSYLQRFPIDTLKIDQSFTARMLEESGSGAIVKTLVDLARNLGMQTVAEGIEHASQAAALAALGCDYGQGFLYARPLPESEVAGFLGGGGG